LNLSLCTIAVLQNGLSLEYIKDNYITYELCVHAVKQNSLALKFVPLNFQTKEICFEAVKNNDTALLLILNKKIRDDIMTMIINDYQWIIKNSNILKIYESIIG
jgi:hypothetical protein